MLLRKFKIRPSGPFYAAIVIILSLLCLINIFSNSSPLSSAETFTCAQLCPYSSEFRNDTLYFEPSHFIRHFSNFVCPQNFRNLADWVYGWPDQFNEHFEVTTKKGEHIAPCLPPGSIIYVRIWVIDDFFKKVYPYLQNKFVLVTGEGDMSSPVHMELLESPDSKIIHWFGQNGQYDASNSKKFTHIPIGINCYEMADAIQSIYDQHPNHTLPSLYNEPDEPYHYVQPRDVSNRMLATTIPNKNLVLINFDAGTDKTGLRRKIWRTTCIRNQRHKHPFITCLHKEGGVQIQNLPSIYNRNREYAFWLSPRGNGIDCHRTWEALYLDIIPIVWSSSLNVLYENLPILIIKDFNELNETFLHDKLKEISKKKLSQDKRYAYEKLRNAYWRRLILSKSRHSSTGSIYRREDICWRAKYGSLWTRVIGSK